MQQNPKLMELNATHCLMLHLMCNTVRRPVTWNSLKDSSLSRNSWSTWQWPTHVKLLRSGLRLRVARNATQGKPTNVGIAFPPYISAWQLSAQPQRLSEARGRPRWLNPPAHPLHTSLHPDWVSTVALAERTALAPVVYRYLLYLSS